VLDAYGIKLIGAQVEAIEKAEDRQLFKQAMEKIGLSVPLSGYAHSLEEARDDPGRDGGRDRRRLPGAAAAVVHAGRLGRGGGLERRGVRHQGELGACSRARAARCWSSSRCWGGRNTSWR
jgi:hypothetical protein